MKEQTTLDTDETFGVPPLLRKQTVLAVTGLSDRSLAMRLAAGTFPKPVLLDARNPAWIATEVREWIVALIEARDAAVKTPVRIAYEEARKRGGEKAQALRRAATSTG